MLVWRLAPKDSSWQARRREKRLHHITAKVSAVDTWRAKRCRLQKTAPNMPPRTQNPRCLHGVDHTTPGLQRTKHTTHIHPSSTATTLLSSSACRPPPSHPNTPSPLCPVDTQDSISRESEDAVAFTRLQPHQPLPLTRTTYRW